MILVCQSCASRIQVDEEKLSACPVFNCPNCNKQISSTPASPAFEKSALSLGNSPSTEGRRYEHVTPAPLFELELGGKKKKTADNDAGKLVQVLSELLNQNIGNTAGLDEPLLWKRRKILLCIPEEQREKMARLLTEAGYQVFVALDTRQAVERMRENQLDVVLLDPQFDAAEQGAAFVVREVNVLRPAQRRRLFFMLISPTLRTMDTHGAFLNNVNGVINVKDIADLDKILDHGLRGYNELYKDFYEALKLAAI